MKTISALILSLVITWSAVLAGDAPEKIPNVSLRDHNGKEIKLYDDLVKGRLVAVNFIFTRCRSICPPMGAQFASLEKELGDRAGKEISLISLSIDPVNDTPATLREWRDQFGAGEGWRLLTGAPAAIETAAKAMEAFVAEKNDHAPFVLVGNDRTGEWRRINGLAPPSKIVEALNELAGRKAAAAPPVERKADAGHARRYFTDTELTDQFGKTHKLYTNLMHNKIVVIHSFFSTCKGVCPAIMSTVKRVRDHLGPRLGEDVHILSLSVDPRIDTSEKLKVYADELGAVPGWYFLTGDPDKVHFALNKFGQAVTQKEGHSNVVIIGNEATGLWKKAFGLGNPDELLEILDSVLEDKGV